MTAELQRSPDLLHRSTSRLLIVDVQDRLAAALPDATRERLIRSCRFLGEAARLLGIPITVTEQYPQGLGATCEPLQEFCTERPAKKRFSALECLNWISPAQAGDAPFQVVVAGMETHVCVLQTVLDLLAAGFQVYVAIDAVASRRDLDESIARDRMAASGAILTTAEGVIFEWTETAAAAEFKAISQLVKDRA